ncbi:MAG: tetratricopeptide repeat protein [Pseudomonadota bacterium]
MQNSVLKSLSGVAFALAAMTAATVLSNHAKAEMFTTKQPSLLRQAERALARGDGDAALELTGALRRQGVPARYAADVYSAECRAQLQLDDALAAEDACREALLTARGEAKWRLYNNLGVAELRLGHYDRALASFQRATRISHRSDTPRRNLALLQRFLRASAPDAGAEQLAANPQR